MKYKEQELPENLPELSEEELQKLDIVCFQNLIDKLGAEERVLLMYYARVINMRGMNAMQRLLKGD